MSVVAPDWTDIYWTDDVDIVRAGVTYNLTCESYNSRPVSSFRWTRDTIDLTDDALLEQGTPDAEGIQISRAKVTFQVPVYILPRFCMTLVD